MLHDSRTISKGKVIETDLCIIGAGVAGITIACEFDSKPFRVALLESGGLNYDSLTQSLYKGEVIGKDYYALDASRLRFFGGTSNHWGGNCREFGETDFLERKWVPNSGWPISKEELLEYYKRALKYCKLDARGFLAESWEEKNLKKLELSESVNTFITQFAPKTIGSQNFEALNFGKAYLDQLKISNNISLFLFANVVDILPNESNSRIGRIRISCIKGGSFFLSAKYFILATGGIENARLLLQSKSKYKNGLGNQNDLVGRYFMEHLSVKAGLFFPLDQDLAQLDMYEVPSRRISPQSKFQIRTKGYLKFAPKILEKEKMLNVTAQMSRLYLPPSHESESYKSLKAIIGDVRHGVMPRDFLWHLKNVMVGFDDSAKGLYWKYVSSDKPINLYAIHFQCEQAPNPDSRITLSREKDILGMNKVKLDWRVTDIDFHTIRKAAMQIALELGRSGIGRLMIDLPESDSEINGLIGGDWHHMGTTRMHKDPQKGVVDQNCRVHGLQNFFVMGSSVFPTGGHSVPTFTITALSIRLADYIKKQFMAPVE